jgi:hypothetical protein
MGKSERPPEQAQSQTAEAVSCKCAEDLQPSASWTSKTPQDTEGCRAKRPATKDMQGVAITRAACRLGDAKCLHGVTLCEPATTHWSVHPQQHLMWGLPMHPHNPVCLSQEWTQCTLCTTSCMHTCIVSCNIKHCRRPHAVSQDTVASPSGVGISHQPPCQPRCCTMVWPNPCPSTWLLLRLATHIWVNTRVKCYQGQNCTSL